ncbi:hypothetical protein C8J55DRAFT_559848 [Lentinula edodes]|uniref:Uncharacterized protein n=1 Tax=Lentinula lateritia TaxID=40482 RepID=A0A9W9AHR6_9AGAR|nr:hypothetical protein C8J55DRAFT_559848 [Lentinula edodes]
MKKLERAFLKHPILGCRRSLEVDELLTTLHSAHCQFIGLSTTSGASGPGTLAPLPQSPSLSTTLSTSSSVQASTPASAVALDLLLQDPHVTFFHDWLLEIAEIYIHSPPLSQDALTIDQCRILNDPDSSCPFRELALSRRQVSGIEGPFAHLSRGAVFSALLFRGIMFNTNALHKTGHPGLFDTFEAWSQFKSQHEHRGERFICNPHAYGTTKGRVLGNDQQFWTSSQVLYEKLRGSHTSFIGICKFITYGKDDRKRKLFPLFGDLLAYLLMVDFVYAGYVSWPMLEEVARAIAELSEGTLHGLQKMGLISMDHFKKEDVEEAFKALYFFLDQDEKFATVKKAVVFDLFMVEHALCKVSKDRVFENHSI